MSAANWGFEWGDAWWGEEQLDVRSRLLQFVRSPNLIALTGAFADRTEDMLDSFSDVANGFDLTTAVGAQLDRLGEILQLPRYGYSDDRYRVLLQIQVQLVLSSTTTTPTILRIVELFAGVAPTSYADVYPMGFRVGAIVAADDAALLVQLLTKAKAAAYSFELVVAFDDETYLIGNYNGTLTDTGVGGYDGVVIPDARPGGYSYSG